MLDRIADPWGARTPYARGAQWPVRVDSFLAEGLSAQDVDTWVPTASILHSNGDALDIAVKDGRIVGVRGRADSRVNHGRLGRTASHPETIRTMKWAVQRVKEASPQVLASAGGRVEGEARDRGHLVRLGLG